MGSYGRARGKIVMRHRVTGMYTNEHLLDRVKLIWNLPGLVVGFERNRIVKTYLALVAYPVGVFAYVSACAGQKIGDRVLTGWCVPLKIGNSLPLSEIPLNIKINSLEAVPGSGATYVRSPGCWALILAKNNLLAKILFKNGTIKFFDLNCLATIGRVSNIHWKSFKLRKAGQRFHFGGRPRVRGVAKNPVDHPHGGGKGKKSKNSVPESPWGRLGARKKKNVKIFF